MHLNTMMDATPIYPEPFHPTMNTRLCDFSDKKWIGNELEHYTRTEKPVNISLSTSRYFAVATQSSPPLEYPILGGDKSVPEFRISVEPCNLFPTDIYYLGNTIRRTLLDVRYILFIPALLLTPFLGRWDSHPKARTRIRQTAHR
jgi:hypothetical protein